MRLNFSMMVSAAALVLAMSARANLNFTLIPGTQSGIGTNEAWFSASLTNSSLSTNLYVNDLRWQFNDSATNYLTADTNVFFANVPGLLLPGETYSDVLVGIAINPLTPPGTYAGTLTLTGGDDIFAATNLISQPFQIIMPPATIGLSLSGTNFVLSWPSPPGGFVLQQSSDLSSPAWTTLTNVPTLINSQNQVTLPPSLSPGFYRLHYP